MAKRRIVVDGAEYTYVVGRWNLRLTDSNGKSRAVPLEDVTGVADIGRARWKRTLKVTPADIERIIRQPVDTPSA